LQITRHILRMTRERLWHPNSAGCPKSREKIISHIFMKISVCMATFNGMPFIKEQLSSILSQLTSGDEIIISDDGSTDGTVEYIQKLGDPRIYLYLNNYRNVIRNVEFALYKCSGDILFLSDQDDIWHKDKVARVICLLKQYDLVVTDADLINEEGIVINHSLFSILKSGKGILNNLLRNTYVGCCMAFNRNVLDTALPFPRFVPMHDSWIGMIGEVFGTTYFYNEPLIHYRRHSSNASLTTGESANSLITKIRLRWNLVASLLLRCLSVKFKMRGV
jgi:glycosyltransferase involved in cell wall biosynthesis